MSDQELVQRHVDAGTRIPPGHYHLDETIRIPTDRTVDFTGLSSTLE